MPNYLAVCLSRNLSCYLPGSCFLTGKGLPQKVCCLGAVLASWEATLSLGRGLLACLPTWGETKLLPTWELLPSWERPSLERVLLGGLCWPPGKQHCTREVGCLLACKELAITLLDCEVSQVIFL